MIRRHPIAFTFVLALLLAATTKTSYATKGEGGGSHAGNGGDVIYCANPLPGQKRIELLDLFESRFLRENVISLGEEGWDYKRRINYVLDRLKRLDAYRAQNYVDISSRFVEKSEFTHEELPDISDSMHVLLPKGCVIRQIVIQRQYSEKTFLVNKPLWEMLDEENRAALVLHETIYWEALSLKQSDSVNTRFFNGTLTSKAMETMNLNAYLELLKKVGFTFQRVNLDDGNWFVLPEKNDNYVSICKGFSAHFFGQDLYGCINYEMSDNKFYLKRFIGKDFWARPNSISDRASFSWPIDGKANGQMLRFYSITVDHGLRVLRGEIAQEIPRKSAHYDLKCGTYSTFSFNGANENDECAISDYNPVSTTEVQGRQVKIVPPSENGYTVTIDSKLDRVTHARFFQPERFSIRSESLEFYGEFRTDGKGNIQAGFLHQPGTLHIPNSSRTITAAKDEQVDLREDGTVFGAYLESGTYLKQQDGGSGYVSAGKYVEFNEKGEAKVY
ncbi:MAG: hypothetical protein ACJ763_11640 [Bdellovibrionia bacterium]